MPEELNRYLTEVEKKQMNAILSKAMARREEECGGTVGDECPFLFPQCRKAKEEEGKVMLEIKCNDALKQLIKEMCCCCPRCLDEDLPF